MKKKMKIYKIGMLTACLLMTQGILWAQDTSDNILDMDLEDLMNMEITSVSKKAERLQDVASSIYVLTSEDIMKTGATTIHEVLRTMPGYWGVQDQYSSVQSAVRISQTSHSYSGTVLYLLDGTPIQDQMNSNFSFRNFDIPLSEIDRIELIRGSGGTIYGANSATGVVNIFTKNPANNKGIRVTAEGAAPGFAAASISAGGALSNKISISGYAKTRFFTGFESMAGVDKTEASRFTEDYDKSLMTSMGLRMNFDISDQTKLSFNSHFNVLRKNDYANYNTENSFDLLTQTLSDELVFHESNTNRFVGNIRLDHSFSDTHSLFFRISTNREKDFSTLGGGYEVSNGILDFEIQDNISLGSNNDLSFGVNYRAVHFDVHDISNTNSINYVNPQDTESLKGGFIQNRIKLLDDKLNFTLGIKAENYSLINDDYYLSPMAKVSYLPTQNLTIWGGYTQSFTTPGYINTNIDYYLFQTPSDESWTTVITQGVYGGVYAAAYQAAVDLGAPAAAAEAAATMAADDFIASPTGQATISAAVADSKSPNAAIKNGDNTGPTKFQTWEAGFRTSLGSKWAFESNFFYTNITGGYSVSLADGAQLINEESITQPGRYATYYLYGNYSQGVSKGTESMIRFRPNSRLFVELAHTWLTSSWEFQENDDFDINAAGFDKNQTPDVSLIPEHVIKLRTSYDMTETLNFNLGIIYASKYKSETAQYKFEEERFISNSFPEEGKLYNENDSRIIVNLRVEKKMLDNKLSVYAFGNDIFNKGIVNTNSPYGTTLSQIGAMYGLGLQYQIK